MGESELGEGGTGAWSRLTTFIFVCYNTYFELIMKANQLHPYLYNIEPGVGRDECEDYNHLHNLEFDGVLQEPTNREQFLRDLVGLNIIDGHWLSADKAKDLAIILLQCRFFYTREELVQWCNRHNIQGSRPERMQREPAEGNPNIATSLSYTNKDYIDYTNANPSVEANLENVTINQPNGHSIHVLQRLDPLAVWDAVDDTLNFIEKHKNHLVKFGKSLYDLVLGRYKNNTMYPHTNKCDLTRMFNRIASEISTTLTANSHATGNIEGIHAFIMMVFGVGLNKKIEHWLSAVGDKTSRFRLSAFYFTVLEEELSFLEYILRMKGHKFCYRMWQDWYELLFQYRELDLTKLQIELESRGISMNESPVDTTEKGKNILALVCHDAGNDPRPSAAASSSSSANHSSSKRRALSLEETRKKIDDDLYPNVDSQFESEFLQRTIISDPSIRELYYDSIMYGEEYEVVRVAVLSFDFATSLADLANERREELEDQRYEAFTRDDFLRGGGLFHLCIEMRINFRNDSSPRDSNQYSDENQAITFFTWVRRAHVHKQQYCQSDEFVVPETGEKYKQLRNFLSWQCGREIQFGKHTVGLRPSEGTPEYNLMLDVGICLDPVTFHNLVEAKTTLAGKIAAQNMRKNNPSSVTMKKSNSAAAALLAMRK